MQVHAQLICEQVWMAAPPVQKESVSLMSSIAPTTRLPGCSSSPQGTIVLCCHFNENTWNKERHTNVRSVRASDFCADFVCQGFWSCVWGVHVTCYSSIVGFISCGAKTQKRQHLWLAWDSAGIFQNSGDTECWILLQWNAPPSERPPKNQKWS